jgi:hypothetical protein
MLAAEKLQWRHTGKHLAGTTMKSSIRAACLLALLALIGAGARAAETPRKARVATGAEVTLVASAKTPAQWTAQRPKVRELRPRARGTFD